MSESNYDGRVTPGGAAQTRDLGSLSITKIAVDPKMSNNCYLLRCAGTGEAVLIDAADEAQQLLALIGDVPVTTVITTHQHWDHHRALAAVVAATGASTVCGAEDAEAIAEQTSLSIDRTVGDGDQIAVGDCVLEVTSIAGHTPGSICLTYTAADGTPHLFTGDSLFPGGVGATFGDADAFAQLLDQVETKLFGTLPDETVFYPGHGDDGVLGTERPNLQEWRERGW